ncbi:PLD nuclease N-terminal domain-containing protein [Thalassobacillus sp. C254]|uniref:PLD nuclease N-terminal domain-containing protein n=1 Tax=Thalassobacillus sp. C254 TaxID=1225341 RepID=UPI000A47D6A7|nr:PLD nuclease N-terminal domain-containing protein [Thalassobacillus sp. C254]
MSELINGLEMINWQLLAPIVVIQLLLIITALADCLKRDKTNGPKWMWIMIIIFVNILGPILYFVIGRKD